MLPVASPLTIRSNDGASLSDHWCINERGDHGPTAGKEAILMFVGEIYEDLELWYPKLRLIEAAAKVVMAGPQANALMRGSTAIRAFRSGDLGCACQ